MAEEPSRLELISTRWTLLECAHHATENAAAAARAHLLERYGGAVRRYLLGALRDPDVADDLFQDFACRFLHGDFKGACPERGRFRDFLKGVVAHMVADFCRRRGRQHVNLPKEFIEPAAPAGADADRIFLESWRDELLARTWTSLAELERRTGQPFYTVLRFRADHPDLRSPELARQLAEALKRPLTAAGVRQLLHRARAQYADLLREHVRASLSSDDPDDVNQELEELGLLAYLRN
jgi:RNA polymerase sigma-70 factor (ECF subfamily)